MTQFQSWMGAKKSNGKTFVKNCKTGGGVKTPILRKFKNKKYRVPIISSVKNLQLPPTPS